MSYWFLLTALGLFLNVHTLTLAGPMIMPVHRVRVMSSSSSRPQLTVPSPSPFCPSSSSSNKRKLRGTLTSAGPKAEYRLHNSRNTQPCVYMFFWTFYWTIRWNKKKKQGQTCGWTCSTGPELTVTWVLCVKYIVLLYRSPLFFRN